MGRIIGIDFGRERVGIAVTDPLQVFASPMATVKRTDFENFIKEYSKTEEVEAFVIGYPVKLNNKPGETVKYIDPFIRNMREKFPGKEIHLVDERFTSRIALRTMIDSGMKKMKRRDKSVIDKISASIILQSFLDKRTFINSNRDS
jgi:putative Holliday junction resolvase